MNRDKQMINDLIEIFEEEYSKRYLITPQNTAEKLTEKGYRKASEVAEEIFAEIERETHRMSTPIGEYTVIHNDRYAELKKKYAEEGI